MIRTNYSHTSFSVVQYNAYLCNNNIVSSAEYMCGFPVHQDGSCNGLQHYAALGGDTAGAAAVNLAPLKRPQDVYSAVAAMVSTEVQT